MPVQKPRLMLRSANGLPSRIWVGDDGHIYSYRRKLRPLTERPNKDGYLIVDICFDGTKREARVHTLVALTFKGPRPEGTQARHLDGVRTNNRPDNLRWGTAKENAADRDAHGTTVRGSKAAHATLTEAQIPAVREMLRQGYLHRVIASRFGVTKFVIDNINRGKTWKHV